MVTDISLIILPYLSTYILGSRTRYYKLVPWQDKRLIEDERDCPEYMLYKNKILKRKKKEIEIASKFDVIVFAIAKKAFHFFRFIDHRRRLNDEWMADIDFVTQRFNAIIIQGRNIFFRFYQWIRDGSGMTRVERFDELNIVLLSSLMHLRQVMRNLMMPSYEITLNFMLTK